MNKKFDLQDTVRVVESSEYLSLTGRVIARTNDSVLPFRVQLEDGSKQWFTEAGLELANG